MKWEIVHRTRYTYASPVRDSFNEARLAAVFQRGADGGNFLLKVLPAARLRHHHDFYSNIVHHFEIAEPHSTLLIESHLRVTTHPPAPLPATATPWPLARIGEALHGHARVRFLAGQPVRGNVAGSLAAGAGRHRGPDRHLAGGAGPHAVRPRAFQI